MATNGKGNGLRHVVTQKGGGWYELPNGKKVHGKQAATMAVLSALQPSLEGRMRFIRSAGLQYGGHRDIYTAAGYIAEGKDTFDHYWALYERDPTAGRIVDMPPKTTWRTPPEILEGDGEEAREEFTDFEETVNTLADRVKMWRAFEKVDRLARIGRYAVLFLGVKGSSDKELATEMPRLTGPEDLLFLASYAEKFAKITKWDTDPMSARFGLPVLYDLNLSSGVSEFPAKTLPVHWSRIIHVAEDPLTDEVFGRPALRRCLNALADMLKVTASTGESYWQLAARVLQAKVDPEMDITPTQVTALGESLEEIVHDLRRQFVGHGAELSWMGSDPPNPSEPLAVFKALMAIGSGIPERVLFGSERGELASTQDEANYFGMINERQEHHAEPSILRPFLDRLQKHNGLPTPAEGFTVVWPELFELTEQEVADANKSRAEAAKMLTPMGGDPRDIVEVDAERNIWLLPTDHQGRTPIPPGAEEEEEEEEPPAKEETEEEAAQP